MSMPPVSTSSRLSDAQAALARGFAVLPLWWMQRDNKCACGKSGCGSPGKHPLGQLVPGGVKDAIQNSQQVEEWWAKFPEANIGIACGKVSKLIVLDCDPRNGGVESLEELQQVCGQLVETYQVQTGGGGLHLYFAYSPALLTLLRASCKPLPGLDVQSNNHYVVGPGSNHAAGRDYKVIGSANAACEKRAFKPRAAPGPKTPPGPDEPGTVDAEVALVDHCNKLRDTIEGERNDYLAKVACWEMAPYIRENAIAQERAEAQLLSAAKACGLGQQESVVTISSALRSAIQNNWPPPKAEGISDIDLGIKFAERYKDRFRYVDENSKWMEWHQDLGIWTKDRILNVWKEAKTLCQEEAAQEKKRAAIQLKSSKTVAAVEKMARSETRLVSVPETWNCGSWLLHTPAGTVEQEGKITIRSPRLEDYNTRSTPVAPGGPAERWLQFLKEITLGDKELIAFLQRVAGYCSTGCIREQKLFYLYGSGGNGKGTFLRALVAALGPDYAKSVQPETFLETHFDQHPTEVAALQGARLVIVPDMPSRRRWNMERIKAFTGGDSIPARFMRGNFFNFDPEFKLFMGGNDKPSLRTVNDAIRRRFVLLPFMGKFLEEKDDKSLDGKLRTELGGILQWILDGCSEWQSHGLRPPKVVTEATSNYIQGEDILAQFIESRCDVGTGKEYRARKADLYAHWQAYCQGTGEEETTRRQFAQHMENAGFGLTKIGGERLYVGLRVRVGQSRLPGTENPGGF